VKGTSGSPSQTQAPIGPGLLPLASTTSRDQILGGGAFLFLLGLALLLALFLLLLGFAVGRRRRAGVAR
jgi:hypothetical protein